MQGQETNIPTPSAVQSAASLLEQLVQIGAPTGDEHRRAKAIADWLTQAGLGTPTIDELANVSLWLGPTDRKAILLDAHTDTVFADKEVKLVKQGNTWWAPGIWDNTVHCALLMVWAQTRQQRGLPWPATLLSFTVGEEGRGDLCGIRKICQTFEGRIERGVALDLALNKYSRQCVGSIRWQVTFEGPGGHSWNDFGQTNAIHAACAWASELESLADWSKGQCSYNVGQIEGGQSINSIAADATLLLDVRSIDASTLAKLKEQVPQHARAIADRWPNLTVHLTPIGYRPAGEITPGDPLVQAVTQVHRDINEPLEHEAVSTNANWLVHQNIPAICTGLITGTGIHTRNEHLDINGLSTGLEKLDHLFRALTFSP